MEKTIQNAVNEINEFINNYNNIYKLTGELVHYKEMKDSQEFKALESIYLQLKEQGFSRENFIDILYKEVEDNKIVLFRCNHSGDKKQNVISFIDFYFTNLSDYQNQKDVLAQHYMKETNELNDLIESYCQANENQNKKGIIQRKK